MIRTMYTVNRNMNVIQKRQENTSGNISNSNTPGYKFKSIMQSTLEPHDMINYAGGSKKDKKQILGEFIFGNQVDQTISHLENGSLMDTGNFTDFAIQGEGFFTLELAGGGRGYTRNGNFRIDENSNLITQTGERVLGRNDAGTIGYINVDENFRVASGGRIIGSEASLLITEINDTDGLVDMGSTIFTTNAGTNIVENPVLLQNYLESSNVDFTAEIVKMIEISREFQSNQKMIQTADETLSKAVNEIGRL